MGRAPCCDKVNAKKGPWSPEEDTKLKVYIEKHGSGGNWIALPKKAGLKRCGKSCRLRWLNYLRPNIKHGGFSVDEDRIICNLFASIGSRWSIIAAQLPGRTDNDIKNYWNTKLKKKILGFPTSQRKPHHHHQQQNHLTFQSSFHNTAPSPSSQSSSFYDPPSNPFFPCFEGLPLSSDELTPFQHLLQAPVHQYQMNSSSRLLVFSNDQSCSSSDGSCRQVNGMGFESYVHGGVEGAQKLLISGGGGGTPLEYKHEEYNTTYLDDLSTSSATAARLEDIRFRT